MRSAGLSGGKTFGDSAGRSMASSISGHAKRAAFLGAAAFAAVGAAAFKLTKDSLSEAREAQKVGALTTQVIKSTGSAAQVTAKQVGDLSGAIGLKTGIDDEAIQSGANLLLTFKNIKNEAGAGNDIFSQTTQIMTDMATAMGNEPKSAAIQLGKALNDPIKGIAALARVGVTFDDQQQKQIKTLVESGKTMEAQKLILGELKSEFGGAAAAQATMGDKVSVAWGNIQEKLGTVLLPLLDDVEHWFLKKGVPAIEGWVDAFQKKGIPAIRRFATFVKDDLVPKLGDFYDAAKPVANDVLPAMVDAADALKPVLKKAGEYAGDLADAFGKMPKWAQTAIVGGLFAGKVVGFGNLGRAGAGLLGGAGGGLLGGISKAAPMPVFVTNAGFGAGGVGVPGAPGAPGAGGKAPFGTLPGMVPLIPIGIGSQRSAGTPIQEPRYLSGPKYNLLDDEGLSAAEIDRRVAANKKALVVMNEAQRIFKTLPPTLQTKIAISGVPESKKAVKELIGQYDLTPTQIRSLFTTAGIDPNTALLKQYRKVIEGVPKAWSTFLHVNGAEAANAQIQTVIDRIHMLQSVGDHQLPYGHGGGAPNVGASTGRGSSPTPPPAPGPDFDKHVYGALNRLVEGKARGVAQDEISFTRDFERRSRGL